jgi:hypothetical protein
MATYLGNDNGEFRWTVEVYEPDGDIDERNSRIYYENSFVNKQEAINYCRSVANKEHECSIIVKNEFFFDTGETAVDSAWEYDHECEDVFEVKQERRY